MHMTQVNCDQLQEWGAIIAPFQQDWNDQIVLAMGLSYQFNDALTGRIGYNYAKNPIPNQFVNYLWPAIAENHYTGGFGMLSTSSPRSISR